MTYDHWKSSEPEGEPCEVCGGKGYVVDYTCEVGNARVDCHLCFPLPPGERYPEDPAEPPSHDLRANQTKARIIRTAVDEFQHIHRKPD